MSGIKTKQHDADVYEFINTFSNTTQKIEDSLQIVTLMEEISGHPPKMWGPSIIGFGSYHYKSKRSKQEGDWPLLGFSPRKTAISLYIFTGLEEHEYLLENLGKFKKGKACIYIKKLSDINIDVLKELMRVTLSYMKDNY